MHIGMELGETRHIRIKVYSIQGESFEIRNARYELILYKDSEIEAQGAANIIDHVLDAIVTPKCCGVYDLKFTYNIADETLIDTVRIYVDNGGAYGNCNY